MKSLLDIQQDIRILESNIQEITDSVKSISSDIEAIRNSSERAALDYSKIEVLAKRINFREHPLNKLKEERACQIYLQMLLNIVRLEPDEKIVINRMIFLQWLQIQSHIDWPLADLYRNCFKTDKQSYYEMVDLIPRKYKEYFLVDALIVANIAGNPNEEIYKYIADIITILGLSAKKVADLALISRLALSQSVSSISRKYLMSIPRLMQGKAKAYSHYIKSNFAKESIRALRVVVIEMPDNKTRDFKWKVEQQQKVECGNVIATYQKEKRSRRFSNTRDYKLQEIKAPVSGVIFQFRDNNTNYGVISHEQDNKDSITAWVKTRK